MPFSTGLSTTLSNFEAGLNYKDVSDPSVMVSFPVLDDPLGTRLVAWTTTPWTLPSNLALCVHPDFDYVQVKDPASGAVYIVAESRLASLPGAVPKKAKGKGKGAPRTHDPLRHTRMHMPQSVALHEVPTVRGPGHVSHPIVMRRLPRQCASRGESGRAQSTSVRLRPLFGRISRYLDMRRR